jgi:REP element-mobilizing transposase RayT
MRRKSSIRLRDFDYTSPGAYFATICIKNHQCILGEVAEDSINLNALGSIADKCWRWIGEHFDFIVLDQYIIMPNHMHGIIILKDDYGSRGGSRTAINKTQHNRKPIGQIIGAFKTRSTKLIKAIDTSMNTAIWQRSYYEHVIRNEEDLRIIREYIEQNPQKWALGKDKYYPG